jgi:hypothetical protein
MGYCGGGLVVRCFVLKENSAVTVEHCVKRMGALRQFVEVALQHLGEGVEQGPRITLPKLRVVRGVPLIQHSADLGGGASTTLETLNNQVVSLKTRQPMLLVSIEAGVLVDPSLGKPAEGARDNAREVTQDVRGVTASELHFATECEVIANEHGRPNRQCGWKQLVVGVADTKHRTVILAVGIAASETHQTEVSVIILGETVRLINDAEVAVCNLTTHQLDKMRVGNGLMRISRLGRVRCDNTVVIDVLRSSM